MGSTRSSTQSRTAPSLFQFDYKWTKGAKTTADAKHIAGNTADVTATTTLYIHEKDRLGRDMSLFLGEFKEGDWLNLHSHDDTDRGYSFDVKGPAVKSGMVFAIPVTYYASSPTNTIPNNDRLDVLWKQSIHAGFIDLKDTPDDYTGKKGLVPRVNTAEDALVFEAVVSSDIAVVPTSHKISNMVWITKANYTAIATPDTDTLYVIKN